MKWDLLTCGDHVTTSWSGGKTTQLAIAPADAAYADRDFLWRISSASVDTPHSDFTPLPDYNRLISPLKGRLELRIGEGERFHLMPLEFCSFDGGVSVESWGLCTDFNLMLRKDRAQGSLQTLSLTAGSALQWAAEEIAPRLHARRAVGFYCADGALHLAGYCLSAGDLLLCRDATTETLALSSAQGATCIIVQIQYT